MRPSGRLDSDFGVKTKTAGIDCDEPAVLNTLCELLREHHQRQRGPSAILHQVHHDWALNELVAIIFSIFLPTIAPREMTYEGYVITAKYKSKYFVFEP